ncbi:MAG: response regulator transcription factor [Nitrospirae bacterium]|nr:response regulator transcription factor [Nitrospirota bacterium]
MSNNKTEHTKHKYNIFIVDDHPIVRQGLALLINQENDLAVCGEASDISQALPAIEDCHPDLIIVDISLGQNNGIRLIESLLNKNPETLTLVLSMHDEALYAERCLRIGAKGYIMKQEPPEKVILAIRRVLHGEIFVSDTLSAKLLHKFIAKQPILFSSPIESLSNRELEVFELIGKGLKTRQIAEHLTLSVKTIETYMDHIKKKMNLNDSRNLFLHAVQWLMNEKSK